MIRAILCIFLSTLTLALGLWTAGLQSQNYERGLALNDLKERCSMMEAINGDQSAQILSYDCAPLPPEPRPAAKPAPTLPSIQPKNTPSIAKVSPRASRSAGVAP